MTVERPFICITGMHRSGTSLVSHIVHLLGVDLGPMDKLMDPAEDNPAGFWENWDLVRLDDAVLHRLGAAWDDPPAPPHGWEHDATLDDLRLEADRIITQTFGEQGPAGWKDPRASFLLPFWRTVVSIQRVVLVLRHPAPVAASLHARNGVSEERAAELWVDHLVAAAVDAEDGILVHYDEVLSDPVSTALKLAEELGLDEPDGAVREEVARASDPSLRHHRADQDADTAPGPVMALACELHALIRDRGLSSMLPVLQEMGDRRRSEAAMRSLSNELDEVRRENAEVHARREALESEIERTRARSDELREALDKWTEEARAFEREANRVELERRELEQRVQELCAENEALNERAAHFEREANRVELERQELEELLSDATSRVEQREREMAALRSSWSVRFGRFFTAAAVRERLRS